MAVLPLEKIDLMPSGVSCTQGHQDKWEGEWGDMRSIGKRLDELSRFLTGTDFDKFALPNKALLESVLADYDPATSFKKFFQEQFFEKRNRIVHYGEIDSQKPAGELGLLMASSLISLFKAMHTQRIKSLEEVLKKDRRVAHSSAFA